MPLLELRNVTKGYGKGAARVDVLHDLSLSVEDGEFVAIVGYSGMGKTTLISLIAGLIRADSGDVFAMGRPVVAPGPDRGVVFQNYSLLPWLSVQDNVQLAVDQVFPKESGEQRTQRTLDAIAKVNLSPAVHKKPGELSGGMRQRVSVARALAQNPQVLLLDEPLSALDALTRAQIQEEIVRIWQTEKKTVVLITNDVEEGLLMADRVIPMSVGPGAKLGPDFVVDLPRPRDRRALQHDAKFRHLKAQIVDWLTGPGKQPGGRPASAGLKKTTTSATDLTIGFLPLTDAAPFIVAHECGLFKKHGLNVKLKRQSSWTQITDALCAGQLDAAHLLFGLPIAATLGLLGKSKAALVIPWIASRNGQAITLSCRYAGKVNADPSTLKPVVDAANAAEKSLTFATTHPLGTHAMWLRYWLGAGGIHPDVDVSLTTVPPAAMVAGLRRDTLDGLCVGEPWNAAAVRERVGFTAITSQEIWRDHPEKVLGVTEQFANQNPAVVKAMCKALHEASVWLDDAKNKPAAARMLSPAHYVNAPADLIEKRLRGDIGYGDGRTKDFGDGAMTFSHRNANYPQLKYVTWWLTQLRRWGMADGPIDYDAVARRVARFDLYHQAMNEIGYTHFAEDKGTDILFDGHAFNPADPEGYARSFRVNTLSNESAVAV